MDKILIADDDQDILRLLEIFLKNEGYEVHTFLTGDELYKTFLAEGSDLVILDIMMPGSSGLDICEKIRAESSVPIILLTAKDTDADYVAGISLGSDDYLVKPFNPTILSMRVKALLRRVKMMGELKEEIKIGNTRYVQKERAIYVNDQELHLTKTEFSCLSYLIEHVGQAISREKMLEEIWDMDMDIETRVTDETIRRIRKKLLEAGSDVLIRNKWGYGYIVEERVEK